MEQTIKTLLEFANGHGFTSVEINPFFKFIVLEGTVDGVQVYDYDGNRISIIDGEHDCRFANIKMEYPDIWGVINVFNKDGFYKKPVRLKYEKGKLVPNNLYDDFVHW